MAFPVVWLRSAFVVQECLGRPPRGLLVDQETWIRGACPATVPEIQPLAQELAGEVVQRPGPAGDDDAPVVEVDVIKAQRAGLTVARTVHGGQGEREPATEVVAATTAWSTFASRLWPGKQTVDPADSPPPDRRRIMCYGNRVAVLISVDVFQRLMGYLKPSRRFSFFVSFRRG
ncbi:hypothetical protein ACQPYV_12840 [Micromonospora saelicesensis]|uniref:hypothetical protein n=1 Tax=Micromonospora saelicesensis TaxID=285676 RepID=UPI003D91B44B